jgi:hypothetical protein
MRILRRQAFFGTGKDFQNKRSSIIAAAKKIIKNMITISKIPKTINTGTKSFNCLTYKKISIS